MSVKNKKHHLELGSQSFMSAKLCIFVLCYLLCVIVLKIY